MAFGAVFRVGAIHKGHVGSHYMRPAHRPVGYARPADKQCGPNPQKADPVRQSRPPKASVRESSRAR